MKNHKTIRRIGLIGLGKIGLGIALHLLEKNYTVVALDINDKAVKTAEKYGIISANSVKQLTPKLSKPRIIILSLPAGKPIDSVINKITPYLSKEDVIIDSGNSFYKDSQLRAKKLKKKGIRFLDVGISGGIEGARNGACLMIGGEKNAFRKAKHLFKALSRNNSYAYLGKSGSGHLAKGFHNLIEYGYLQALSEGILCLQMICEKERLKLNVKDVCEVWNKGSIIESKLIGYLSEAFKRNPGLKGVSGSVLGQSQKEMEKLILLAKYYGIRIPSCKAAIDARKKSQKKPTPEGVITNAVRNIFGGHKEWEKQ